MHKHYFILVLIFSILFWGLQVNAQGQYSSVLTKMEKNLFGVDFNTQSDEARVKRIEENVYGASSNNSMQIRISKLSKDLSVDLIGKEIKPKKDTFEEPEDSVKEEIPKADKNINYPIVNKLEQKIFKQEYKNNDINQRLAALEQKVFKKSYSDDLNSRVERLKQAIAPEMLANNNSDDEDSGSTYIPDNDDLLSQNDSEEFSPAAPIQDDDIVPSYNSRKLQDNFQGNADISVHLSAVERKILKKSFPDDTVSNRLTRLELNIFHSTFVDDDPETRLGRVASAYQAKKTSKKYDSNRFAQHTAAAMQVGAILLMILAAIL